MQEYVARLQTTVETQAERLRAISDADAGRRPAPDKWSPKEIVGHLIDSASNNHQRFVRAQFRDDLVFDGYSQEEWVTVQRYAEAPWLELIELWRSYNMHLARVMAAVPPAVRDRPVVDHNFDQIAWRTVPAGQATTLDYFMADYVGHLEHHLAQIP